MTTPNPFSYVVLRKSPSGRSLVALCPVVVRVMLTGGMAFSCASGAQGQTPASPTHGETAVPPSVPSATSVYGPPTPAPVGALPTVRVTLSKPIYYIAIDPKTGEPQMPRDVTANADVQNWPIEQPRPKTFVWHIALDWNYLPYPTHHDISKTTFVRPSPFTCDFGRQIRGGTLTVTAKTPFNGREIIGQATATVRGVNPTRTAILNAFPRTRFGLISSKVAMAESSFCQFTEPRKGDPGGMPAMSRTNDVGIMQLNAPTGSVTSQDQIWDWRENLRRGMEELAGKQRTALIVSRHATSSDRLPDQTAASLTLLNFCREFIGLPPVAMPRIEPLSDRLGTGLLSDDPDVDHLKLSQLEREAIRRYNGGREYCYCIFPDPLTPDIGFAGWQVDPTRGGLRARSGDLDYVRHVLRAHSGLTLPPPPKPHTRKQDAKHKTRTRRRKHPRN